MKTLGVLGGMGPLATADFIRKVIELTPAERDQEHIPIIAYSVPQVPDRTGAVFNGTEDPFPYMLKGIKVLENAEVDIVAITCNTAHYWHSRLQEQTNMKVLHIADATRKQIEQKGNIQKVGLLAYGDLSYQIYKNKLSDYEVMIPDDQKLVDEGIRLVKAGDVEAAHPFLERSALFLFDKGCDAVILGCTEIPVALDSNERYIDTNKALAIEAVNETFGRIRTKQTYLCLDDVDS